MKKSLVAYFSASGVTAEKAAIIATITGGDLFEIIPKVKYQPEDLDWENETSRRTIEMKNLDCRPEIAEAIVSMEQYAIVFIGFPIWWFRAPSIIDTFLESYDFSGKTIIPFATSMGSPFGDTEKRLHEISKGNARWLKAKMLTDCDEKEVKTWINELER